MIKTIVGLYRALDLLLEGIGQTCKECQESHIYQDCVGYVWLLPEEVKKLLSAGIEIVEVNGRIHFLNSFSDGKGGLNIEAMKPPCPHCKSNGCSIRSLRPFVCRLYPLGFSLEDGMIKLVLHEDCLFSERNKGGNRFENKAIALFRNIDHELLGKVIKVYRLVVGVSSFPDGSNKVRPIMVLWKERR